MIHEATAQAVANMLGGQSHRSSISLCDPCGIPEVGPPGTAGERPQEKGIDVALALDFAVMAVRGEYDVGILRSTDTDLKPALEFVAGLTNSAGRPRAEVAAWSSHGQHNRRLAITTRNLYCHWISKTTYASIADITDHSASGQQLRASTP